MSRRGGRDKGIQQPSTVTPEISSAQRPAQGCRGQVELQLAHEGEHPLQGLLLTLPLDPRIQLGNADYRDAE
jgi:hypothetical protein